MALVDGGSVRVGWPGAPGCTTIGCAFGSDCCALADSDKKQMDAPAAKNALRDTLTIVNIFS